MLPPVPEAQTAVVERPSRMMPPHWPWVTSLTPLLARFCCEVKMIGWVTVPTAWIFEPRLTSSRSLVGSVESAAMTTPAAMVSVTPAPPVAP